MRRRSNRGQARAAGGRVGLAVVRGPSMLPTLRPGDRLLVRYAARPAAGRIVVARYPDGVLAVKRAVEPRDVGWWLRGDAGEDIAPGSVDSRQLGPIPDRDLIAVVVARIWPRPRPL